MTSALLAAEKIDDRKYGLTPTELGKLRASYSSSTILSPPKKKEGSKVKKDDESIKQAKREKLAKAAVDSWTPVIKHAKEGKFVTASRFSQEAKMISPPGMEATRAVINTETLLRIKRIAEGYDTACELFSNYSLLSCMVNGHVESLGLDWGFTAEPQTRRLVSISNAVMPDLDPTLALALNVERNLEGELIGGSAEIEEVLVSEGGQIHPFETLWRRIDRVTKADSVISVAVLDVFGEPNSPGKGFLVLTMTLPLSDGQVGKPTITDRFGDDCFRTKYPKPEQKAAILAGCKEGFSKWPCCAKTIVEDHDEDQKDDTTRLGMQSLPKQEGYVRRGDIFQATMIIPLEKGGVKIKQVCVVQMDLEETLKLRKAGYAKGKSMIFEQDPGSTMNSAIARYSDDKSIDKLKGQLDAGNRADMYDKFRQSIRAVMKTAQVKRASVTEGEIKLEEMMAEAALATQDILLEEKEEKPADGQPAGPESPDHKWNDSTV